MTALESAKEFVDFLSSRGHIRNEVEIVHEPGGTSGMFFSQKDGRYKVFLSDTHALYHEIAHIVLKEDGIEPLSILLDSGAPGYVGHIAGSAIPNFYVNSFLQSVFEDSAPEGVLNGIELYRMDKQIQFNGSMTLQNFCSSTNRALGFYDLFASLSVARALKLPDIAISLERLAGEAGRVNGGNLLSPKVSQLRKFVHSLPDYNTMKNLCMDSPRPQAELTAKLFSLLSPGFLLGFKEATRERILYFIK